MKTAVLALLLGLCAYASADNLCPYACRSIKGYCGKGYSSIGSTLQQSHKSVSGTADSLLKQYCSEFPNGCGGGGSPKQKDSNNAAQSNSGDQICSHACSSLKGYCGDEYAAYTFSSKLQGSGKKVSGKVDTLLKSYCAAYPDGCGNSGGGSSGGGGTNSNNNNDGGGDSNDNEDSGESDPGSNAKSGTNSAACAMKQSSGASQKCLNLNKMRKEAMDKTNEYRAQHGASALVEDECLNGMAQTYAEKLIAEDKFDHSKKRGGCGENLYSSWGSKNMINKKTNGADGITSWYEEIKDYNFNTGASKGGVIGHFTQLVWKGSKRVGHGIASNSDCSKILVVANYDPPGNYGGQYIANVSQ